MWYIEDLGNEPPMGMNTSIFAQCLREMGQDLVVLPAANLVDPNATFVYGSTRIVKAAMTYGVEVFPAPTESEVLAALGDMYLNSDMQSVHCSLLREAMTSTGNEFFFIKPDTDLKMFAGTVVDVGTCDRIVEDAMYRHNTDDFMVCFSSIKNVHREWRLFVVGGDVVTGSQYMVNRIVKTDPEMPWYVTDFASAAISKYPAREMMVVDIAEEANGRLSVIEYNTINCSGLYKADVKKLIKAIQRYKER